MELFKLTGKIALTGVDGVQEDIKETAKTAEDSETKMTDTFKKIGGAVATYFAVDKIIDFGSQLVTTSAEVSAEASAFEQIMGEYSGNASNKMEEVATKTGAVSTRLTPYMTSMTAKFKGLGYGIDEATTLACDGLELAMDASAFWDKSLEDSMGSLNSFINGSYEGGEAIGIFANDTQMASYAVKSGVVESTKAWADLDEATKQATRLQYAKDMMAQSGATGQASKEAGQYANVQANLNEKWRQFQAQIGEPILQNVVIPAMDVLSGIVDILAGGFELLSNAVGGSDVALGLIGITIGTITALIIAYKVQQALATAGTTLWSVVCGGATAVTTALAGAFAFLTSPIGLVILAIGALIAIGYVLWDNWEVVKEWLVKTWESIKTSVTQIFNSVKQKLSEIWTSIKNTLSTVWNGIKDKISSVMKSIKSTISSIWNGIKKTVSDVVNGIKSTISNVFNGVKSTVSTVWEGIKNAITGPIEKAKEIIKGIVDTIAGFFNIDISLPHIKLPHFVIEPEGWSWGDLLKGDIPSLGIDWYAKAMDDGIIMTKPTVFGINGDKLMAGGEAGSETVVGTGSLMNMIQSAVGQNNAQVVMLLSEILRAIIGTNDGLYEAFVSALEDGCQWEWNDRELGRMVRKYAGTN